MQKLEICLFKDSYFSIIFLLDYYNFQDRKMVEKFQVVSNHPTHPQQLVTRGGQLIKGISTSSLPLQNHPCTSSGSLVPLPVVQHQPVAHPSQPQLHSLPHAVSFTHPHQLLQQGVGKEWRLLWKKCSGMMQALNFFWKQFSSIPTFIRFLFKNSHCYYGLKIVSDVAPKRDNFQDSPFCQRLRSTLLSN